jgi:hypothetical protein
MASFRTELLVIMVNLSDERYAYTCSIGFKSADLQSSDSERLKSSNTVRKTQSVYTVSFFERSSWTTCATSLIILAYVWHGTYEMISHRQRTETTLSTVEAGFTLLWGLSLPPNFRASPPSHSRSLPMAMYSTEISNLLYGQPFIQGLHECCFSIYLKMRQYIHQLRANLLLVRSRPIIRELVAPI